MSLDTHHGEVAETILTLERGALERWNRGDVDGCLELYADDVTYFDPITAQRLDGRAAVEKYFRAFFEGKLAITRYEILGQRVIVDDDLAVLTYNLVNYVRAADGAEKNGTPWNSTQVYRRIAGRWRVVHAHWAFTRHPAATAGIMS
jgi:uncharacterized protein (TIGR02246 family)